MFIVQHFEVLVKSSTIFKLLDVGQFKEILASPNLRHTPPHSLTLSCPLEAEYDLSNFNILYL